MTKLTQSYVHGASPIPLIGDTIGVHFDRAVARWPEREALVVSRQDVRWSYTALKGASMPVPPGCSRWGSSPGTALASGPPTTPSG